MWVSVAGAPHPPIEPGMWGRQTPTKAKHLEHIELEGR